MSITLTWYWWFTPLLITIIAAIPGINYRPRGDYDFGGAIMGLIWVISIKYQPHLCNIDDLVAT